MLRKRTTIQKEEHMTTEPLVDNHLFDEMEELKKEIDALKPKPPETVWCDVEQRLYLAHDAKGFRHLQKIAYQSKPWGNACGPCSNHGENTRLEDILDYLASRKLGFAKGTRLMGAGEVLLPYVQAKVPLSRITPERLAADFDRHPRWANKPHTAMVPGEKREVDRYSEEGRQYKERVELGKFVTDPSFDPQNPGRSRYRPLLPSEKEEQLIEQLDQKLRTKVAQQASRKANLQRQIKSLEGQLKSI